MSSKMFKVFTCLSNIAQQKMHSSTLNFDHLLPDMMRLPLRRIFFAGIFHPPPFSASSQTQSIPEHTGERGGHRRGYKGGRKRLSLVRPIDIAGGGEKREPSSSPFSGRYTKGRGKTGEPAFFWKKAASAFPQRRTRARDLTRKLRGKNIKWLYSSMFHSRSPWYFSYNWWISRWVTLAVRKRDEGCLCLPFPRPSSIVAGLSRGGGVMSLLFPRI